MGARQKAWTTGLLFCLAATACESPGPLEPEDVRDVSIALGLSGGLAGISLALVVDGAAGEARGVRCDNLCDWAAGEVILPVSDAVVADLASRLEQEDVFGHDGDVGSECCDMVDIDLTYRRGLRSARIRGVATRLPAPLARAIGLVSGLAYRQLPVLVARHTEATDWPRAPYTLGTVEARGTTLAIETSYPGGCAPHRMDLVAYGDWLESDPVQVPALLTHDDGGDSCEALVTEERVFDLTPLAHAYTERYGPQDGPIRIALRLWDPLSGSPLGRLVELEL